MEDRRGPWFLLTGLILGAALGLLYSWVLSPVKYVDTAPLSLRADFKDTYRKVIAAAYASSKDIGRARARLALLDDSDPAQALAAQAQRILAEGGSSADARSLALLAGGLGQRPASSETPAPSQKPSLLPLTPTPSPTLTATASPTLTVTPLFTITPSPTAGLTQLLPSATPTRPTPTLTVTSATRVRVTPLPTQPSLTPTLTPGLPFVLKERSKVCDASRLDPLLEVQLNDAAGNPVPGIEIRISWTNGEDHFFTGFKPEVNPGYADFLMTPDTTYNLQIQDGGAPVSGITTVVCTQPDGQTYPGGWYLKFSQP